MILGCLLGNTTVQFCLFDGMDEDRPLERVERVGWRDLDAHAERLAALWAEVGCDDVVVGSVRDDLLPRLEACLPAAARLRIAGRDFEVPLDNRYERPEQVGLDRLLNALAASRRASGRGAIVVDFGTTISISVVSANGAFLGGAIAPGLGCAAAGLAARTPVLPRFELERRPPFLGRTTAAGLQSGVYWQAVGGVSRILRGLAGELADDLADRHRVYATGGDAALFAPALEEVDHTVPELTLEGLRISWRQASDGRD